MTDRRRVAVLRGGAPIIVNMLKQRRPGYSDSYDIMANALPDDAVIVGCEYDPFTSELRMLIWSATFDEVPEGSMAPDLHPPVIRSHWLPIHDQPSEWIPRQEPAMAVSERIN